MHVPVLLDEVVRSLDLQSGDIVVDATINRGGHAEKFCEAIGKKGTLVGIDLDQEALDEAQVRLKDFPCKTFFVKNSFRNLDKVLEEAHVSEVDAVLLDLGFSSNQMDESGRGFSFQKDEPLLMTLKDSLIEGDLTAKEIVNEWDEKNIADILYGYGEEVFSRGIAKKIVEKRKEKSIETSGDLVSIIEEAVPNWYKSKKIHCATKTFQALRIAVNDELNALKEVLPKAYEVLKSGGRIAVISFHSLEDRIVKQFFNTQKKEGLGTVITKKPITPTMSEVLNNPRSRSAKLRILVKN